MAGVETTAIHVDRRTGRRLQEEAELAGKTVSHLLQETVATLENERLLADEEREFLESAERCWAILARLDPEVLATLEGLDDRFVRELESSLPAVDRN